MDENESLDSIRKIKLLLNNKEPSKMLNNESENTLSKTFNKLVNVNSNVELHGVATQFTKLEFDIMKCVAKKMTGKSVRQHKIDLSTSFDFDELKVSLQDDIEDVSKAKNIDQFVDVVEEIIDDETDEDVNFYKAIKEITKNLIGCLPSIIKSM